ncbi:MAG: nucleotidyltransferase family protein [Firmicutes bacterium]|nr:nucleotidyltransferase family protein [Bacillota bacterium]
MFLKLVDRHRVAPLVYTNLSRYAGKTAPSAMMSALRSRFESNTRRGLANAAETGRLCQLFQENAIPVLSLKGSALALQAYGSLALRHAGDIDLLVAPHHVDLADHLLQRRYRRTVPRFPLTSDQGRRFFRLMHHFGYRHNHSRLRVELHWRPLINRPSPVMNPTRLQNRASTLTVGGSPLPTLSFLDNLLYLCAHGAAHLWYRLFWLVDLAEMLRGNPEIDWRELIALAREADLMRTLAQGVILAHELLEAPLPEAIRAYALRDRLVPYSAKVAFRFMLCLQTEAPPISLILQRHLCNLRTGNSFQDKLRTLQEICLGQDWLTLGLPDSLFFLYFLLRFPLWLQRRLRGSGKQRA